MNCCMIIARIIENLLKHQDYHKKLKQDHHNNNNNNQLEVQMLVK